jgi:membrane-bound lytic murein transglycosylase D
MFKRNYTMLGDWTLAIIAYNHGTKGLRNLRKQFGRENIAHLLLRSKKTPLGYASRSYYAEFLAMLYAERYRDELYGLPFVYHSAAISIVKMKKPASVFELAALYNISVQEIRRFNRDIFDIKRRLPAGTRIVLPRKMGESLVAAPVVDPSTGAPAGGGPAPGRGIASGSEIIEYIH